MFNIILTYCILVFYFVCFDFVLCPEFLRNSLALGYAYCKVNMLKEHLRLSQLISNIPNILTEFFTTKEQCRRERDTGCCLTYRCLYVKDIPKGSLVEGLVVCLVCLK